MGIYVPIVAGVPEFTYSGTYDVEVDESGNWKVFFLTSGTLTFTKIGNAKDGIDVFIVGGGAGGGPSSYKLNTYVTLTGGGGGGGYTKTISNLTIEKNTPYIIEIGAGGAVQSNGGLSSAFGYGLENYAQAGGSNSGGAGGSGGGGAGYTSSSAISGGSDGGNGSEIHSDLPGGTGQGTTTKEFGETTGTLYSTGGDGGGAGVKNGSDNTGNGGNRASKGGSGIVVIRNSRS